MDIPKQSQVKSAGNMRSVLIQHKPVSRLHVLELRARNIGSWHTNAMQLARLWERMRAHQAVAPKLVPLFARWARLLLKYGKAYGVTPDSGFVATSINNAQQGSVWLATYLAEVAAANSIEDVYGQPLRSFQVKTWRKNDAKVLCSVTHTTPAQVVVYRTRLKGTAHRNPCDLQSGLVGMNTFDVLEKRIKVGLVAHRSVKAQDELVQEIEKHVGRHERKSLRTHRILG